MQRMVRLVVWSLAAFGGRKAFAQQAIERRLAVAPTVSVRVQGGFGSLRVVAWDKDSLVITGTIPKGARFDGGGASGPGGVSRAAKYFVDDANVLAGATPASLELRVPARARIWAKSANADIEVVGIEGSLDLNVIGGAITVNANPSELMVESMDGSILVEGSPRWSRLKTATGDITLRGSCEDLGVITISGTVRVGTGAFERARLESVTGAATFSGAMRPGGSLVMDTHSGTITLVASKSPSLEIEASATAGRIQNRIGRQRPVEGRNRRGEELNVTLGGGEAQVTLRTFKGNIVLASGADR